MFEFTSVWFLTGESGSRKPLGAPIQKTPDGAKELQYLRAIISPGQKWFYYIGAILDT